MNFTALLLAASITGLTVEHKVDPVAMDETNPRFSWRVEGVGDKMQTARRIVVTEEGGEVVWDSGLVHAGDSVLIEYAGSPLKPFTRYDWCATAHYSRGGSGDAAVVKSPSASFETGFLGTPWSASKWITGATGQGVYRPATRIAGNVVVKKPLKRARLYATALGLYVPFVNGREITANRLMPGWTQYEKRVQYQAYDVTGYLAQGTNSVAALLADGWFAGTISRVGVPISSYGWGRDRAFRAELRLEYADGSTETVGTGRAWRSFYADPATQESDIYHGEEYNALYDDVKWKGAPGVTLKGSGVSLAGEWPGEIVWQSGADVTVVETRKPVKATRRPTGTWLLDFGENVAGVEKITLRKAAPGAVIAIRHGETLDKDGNLYTGNLSFAKQRTLVTCGDKPFTYTPRFTFYGFRYLEVSGWPEDDMADDSIVVEVLSSISRPTGSFTSSDSLLNRFYMNTRRSQLGNFVDVPTDCPQRCERFGWTGDAQIFAETALMHFDSAAFFTKWIADLMECRSPEGIFPCIAPYQPGEKAIEKLKKGEKTEPKIQRDKTTGGVAGWSDAGVVCPWMVYRKYGDRRILAKTYDAVARYVDLQDAAGDRLKALGDHLAMDAGTPKDFLGQAQRIAMLRIMTRWAGVIGKTSDADRFKERAARRLAEFRARHFTAEGELKVKTQTAAAYVLAHDLAPDAPSAAKAADYLVGDIAARGNKLSAGFMGAPLLLPALEKAGRLDAAYALLLERGCPSWLYPVTMGATSVWERWDAIKPDGTFHESWMNSFNHYAYGCAAAWLYSTVGGIRDIAEEDTSAAGWKRFRLMPRPGGALTHAEVSFDSPYGKIESAWKKENGKTVYTFTVPCNTTAELLLAGEAPTTLLPGTHVIRRD